MKRFFRIAIIMGTLLIAAALVWAWRHSMTDALTALRRPALPAAVSFATPAAPSVSTSTDPLAWDQPFPRSINLAAPFVLQAPKQNWELPYQEACEEAAAIMVDGYFRGQKKFSADEQERAILAFVEYEKRTLGFYEDTTAEQTAQMIRGFYGWKTVLVRDLKNADHVKSALAHGYPVIIPAYGKALKNPNYRHGGPLYHMIVVKGYLPDGRWITNDSGTRKGADYVYDTDVLMDAAHDWNNGDVPRGKRVMIVVVPQ